MTYEKIAIVTGSSKGIGRAIAVELARNSYHVYVTYHSDHEGAEAAAAEISGTGGSCKLIQLDVTSHSSVNEFFSQVQEEYGHLDLLVNNAVKEVSKAIDEATYEEWKTVIESKLNGAFLCTKASLPLLRAAKSPSVIMISSYEGIQPSANFVAYGAATSGLDAFVKSMALFLPRYGARCNAVCPGPVRTPLWGDDYTNDHLWEELATANPTGRNATPEDVAEVVTMVAEEKTRMLNGSFLYVNGGNHLRQP